MESENKQNTHNINNYADCLMNRVQPMLIRIDSKDDSTQRALESLSFAIKP